VSAEARETPASPPDHASHDKAERPALAIVAAVAANAVIGDGNRLPWRLPADLKRFRALTAGHAVIMGRRTWESIGRALPDRQNIVVTRQAAFAAMGAEIASSIDDAIARVRVPGPAFCIGGGELYRAALPQATTLYLTEIGRAFDGDATFPDFDRTQWCEVDRVAHGDGAAGEPPFSFVTYRRILR
jgi:dihydrofolate reductase